MLGQGKKTYDHIFTELERIAVQSKTLNGRILIGSKSKVKTNFLS